MNFFLHNFLHFMNQQVNEMEKQRIKLEKEKIEDAENEANNFRRNKNFYENNDDYNKYSEFENIPEEKCVFYQNSYYDKRLFTLDEMTYAEFFESKLNLNDYNPSNKLNKTNKNSISNLYSENFRKEKSNKGVKTNFFTKETSEEDYREEEEDINYVYLISKPFFGWNKKFCYNNPKEQIHQIFNLYSKSNFYVDFLLFLKLISFIYIVFILLMQKLNIEFENGFYVGTNNCDRKMFIVIDFIYFFINLMCLFNVIYLVMNVKNINKYNYLELIKQNCLDNQSNSIIGYLSDSCEESIIYCFLLISVISIDIILYSIVIMKSYRIKSGLVTDKFLN